MDRLELERGKKPGGAMDLRRSAVLTVAWLIGCMSSPQEPEVPGPAPAPPPSPVPEPKLDPLVADSAPPRSEFPVCPTGTQLASKHLSPNVILWCTENGVPQGPFTGWYARPPYGTGIKGAEGSF